MIHFYYKQINLKADPKGPLRPVTQAEYIKGPFKNIFKRIYLKDIFKKYF